MLGDEAVDLYLANYAEPVRLLVWKRILKSGFLRNGKIFHEEMAQKFSRFSDQGIYGELKEVVWLRWANFSQRKLGAGLSWQETLEEYQRSLPNKYQKAFGKACLEPVKRITTGGSD